MELIQLGRSLLRLLIEQLSRPVAPHANHCSRLPWDSDALIALTRKGHDDPTAISDLFDFEPINYTPSAARSNVFLMFLGFMILLAAIKSAYP